MRAAAAIVGSAALVAIAAAAPVSAAAPTCAQQARAAIAQTKPKLALIGDKVLIGPAQADGPLCFDVTGDDRADVAVPVASGGTAGDVGWLLFVPTRAGWRLAGSGTGYKMGLFRSGSRLLAVQPVYRTSDPNCCPTGGFHRTLYRWNGSRLVVARSWHTKTFR